MAKKTAFHKVFATVKATVPVWLSGPMRTAVTATLTPIMFSYNSGHFQSTLKRFPVSKYGEPIPWYSYPCVDFLRHRPFQERIVLEFGGGQSTLWWATRARNVVTVEEDGNWLARLAKKVPSNVDLYHIPSVDRNACVDSVVAMLGDRPESAYDVIVIDGLWRFELIDVALRSLTSDGMIICDDADGYGFRDGFAGSGLSRVDFYGHVPGGAFPHVTSIFFPPASFAFQASHDIPIAAFP